MPLNRAAAVTRSLLGWGVVAGPFYLLVGLAQAFLREGFDFGKHPLSVLANGPWGWVQTVNFLLTGLMVLAAVVGIGRVVPSGARGLRWLLGLFALSMIVAAFFPADPMDGFPPGTPVGPPTTISSTGMVHFMVGALGFTALGVSGLFGAWTLFKRGVRGLAWLSVFSAVAVLGGFFGGAMLGAAGVAGIWFAVVVGFGWLAVLCLHFYRVSPDPNC